MATLLHDLAPASLCQNTLLIYTAFPLCATVHGIFSLRLALLAAFAQQVFSPLVTKRKISHKDIITFQEDPFSWFIQSAKHMPVLTTYLSSIPLVVFLPQIVKHYRSKLGFVHFAVPCISKMLNMRYHEWLNKYLTNFTLSNLNI